MNKNTLYISDLDGTLLNSECKISKTTAEIISRLIDDGLMFSVATARTNKTVEQLCEKLHIKIPVILMNGVALYDLESHKFISFEKFDIDYIGDFLEIIEKYGSKGFLYTIENGELETFYVNTNAPNSEEFMRERIQKYDKKFMRTNSFLHCADMNCVHFSLSDKKEALQPVFDEISKLNAFSVEFYRDIYNDDFWYLEICSRKASKYNAALKLKEMLKCERIVSFGDNLNDLPLFAASDESYAVEGAKDEVKAKACGIIASNNEDGVAWFLDKLQR